jgi:hypothetical protein
MRRGAVLLLLLFVAVLVGCYRPPFPYHVPLVDPYPYSFTDPAKQIYPLRTA